MAEDDEPQISILDARLAEIDRRLSRIQTGLAEEVGAPAAAGLPPRIAVPEPQPALRRPAAAVPEPGAASAGDDAGDDAGLVVAELRGLISDHARLLDRLGEILASGERVLATAHAAPAAPPAPHEPASSPAAITVSAGPFSSVEAVRGFERALQSLPGVDGVEIRGYEGGDRALVDVHLSTETA